MQIAYFLGKFISLQDARRVAKNVGLRVIRKFSQNVNLIVLGESDIFESSDWNILNDWLDDTTRLAFETGEVEIISETNFFCRFAPHITLSSRTELPPLMLAELIKLPITTVRSMIRKEIITPSRSVNSLQYFDAQSVITLNIVKNMLDAGVSLQAAAKKIEAIKRNFSDAAEIIRNEGKDIIATTKSGKVDQNGQYRFNFGEDFSSDLSRSQLEPLTILETIF